MKPDPNIVEAFKSIVGTDRKAFRQIGTVVKDIREPVVESEAGSVMLESGMKMRFDWSMEAVERVMRTMGFVPAGE